MALLKVRQKRSPERRRAILDAAVGVLGRKGVHVATLTDISHAAGVPLPSVYDYFADKTWLLASLPAATFAEFQAAPNQSGLICNFMCLPITNWRRRDGAGPSGGYEQEKHRDRIAAVDAASPCR
jgi:AcrR family transcriptional regulator